MATDSVAASTGGGHAMSCLCGLLLLPCYIHDELAVSGRVAIVVGMCAGATRPQLDREWYLPASSVVGGYVARCPRLVILLLSVTLTLLHGSSTYWLVAVGLSSCPAAGDKFLLGKRRGTFVKISSVVTSRWTIHRHTAEKYEIKNSLRKQVITNLLYNADKPSD